MHFHKQRVTIRWSDLDPNFHVRHSVYYDWGAKQRVSVLEKMGLTLKLMQQEGFGPILFREECVFKKEIRLSDEITIDVQLVSMREDGSRWTMAHNLVNQNNELCAVITIDGAWIDVRKRKLADPTPAKVIEVMKQLQDGV